MTVHANWREAGSGSRLKYVFARDFATADGHRVMVAALTPRQFADLATMARLARTFASRINQAMAAVPYTLNRISRTSPSTTS